MQTKRINWKAFTEPVCALCLWWNAGVPVSSSNAAPSVFRTTVSFGNSVELKCDSTGDSGVVVWKRNGNDLGDIEDNYIKVTKLLLPDTAELLLLLNPLLFSTFFWGLAWRMDLFKPCIENENCQFLWVLSRYRPSIIQTSEWTIIS